MCFSEYLLGYFGPDFINAKYILYILAISQMIVSMTGLSGHFLNMVNKELFVTNIFLRGEGVCRTPFF